MTDLGEAKIPEQEIEFFIENDFGYKHKCKGKFWGTLSQNSRAGMSQVKTIDVELTSWEVEISLGQKAEKYVKQVEKLAEELLELKNKINDEVWRL